MGGIAELIKHGTRRLRASSYVGRLIGGYRVTGVAGVGAFGIALRAESQENGCEVLLKLVDGSQGRDAGEVLWPEAAALAKCNHPGIPAWLGILLGKTHERFMAQTMMSGESLEGLLRLNRLPGLKRRNVHAFTAEEIARIGTELIDILTHAFSRGVIHGDVRPANVLFDEAGVSLVDFGLACFFEPPLAQVVFKTDAMIDRMGLADTLLFLLYSDPCRVTRLSGDRAVWMHELALTDAQRQLLFDLFDEECRFADWEDIQARFQEAFALA